MKKPWYDQAFGAHYPLLYQHRDETEAQACLDLLNKMEPLPTEDTILDLGCGEGRHLRSLACSGFQLVGMDLSWPLLELASQRRRPEGDSPWCRYSLTRGDMQQLPFVDQSLGAVLSLFTAFGYFGNLKANLPVIREVARVLKDGGYWYLDYVDCHSVYAELEGQVPAPRVRELGPLLSSEKRRITADRSRVEKEVQLLPQPGREHEALKWGVTSQGVRYTESVALFEAAELVQLCRECGLKWHAHAGSYQGAAFGEGKRWIFVFQKSRSR